MEKHAKLIRDYYIYSLEEFDKFKNDIISLCDAHNARAYFRLNGRDAEKIAFQYNKRLAELLITRDFKNIPRSYAAVVGEFHHDTEKTWVVDIDWEDGNNFEAVTAKILELNPDAKVCEPITTKNGVHLIVRPFRLDVFKNQFPKIDVHKDNPTILYMP